MPRLIRFDLRVDWFFSGSFQDESARLVSANGTVRLAAPESSISSPRGTVDQCTLTLDNHDGRFSPLNTSGPLYSAIGGGGAYHAPMYLRVSVDGGSSYSRVFTGVIKIPQDAPPMPGTAGLVTVDCRSRDEILLNKRLSTPISTFRSFHDTGATEATIITSFLGSAGLSSADYAIDSGAFVIPWAWLDDESPIEDIWNLAAACGGRFYCDQDGIFRYENAVHWLFAPHNTSQETITEAGYGSMEGPTYNDRELYSSVTVYASPRDFLENGPVWSAEDTVVVGPGASKAITAKLRQPAYSLSALTFTATSAGGHAMQSDISIGTIQFAQRCEITLTNTNTTYAAELLDLQLVGVSVNGGPTIEEARASSAGFWTSHPTERPGRVRLLRGNVYIQTQAQAASLAEFLRDRYQVPRLTWGLRNVPGLPTRRLGDRITVANSQVMTSSRQGFITSIAWRLSNMGFTQDIDVMDAGNVADGTGLFPYAAYFIIGTDEFGSAANPDSEHIFY